MHHASIIPLRQRVPFLAGGRRTTWHGMRHRPAGGVLLALTAILVPLQLACAQHAPAPAEPPATVAPARPPAPSPPVPPPEPIVRQETLPFVARAAATTQELAYTSARRRLLVALLNDESLLREEPYSNELLLTVHDPTRDPLSQKTSPEGIEVEAGLRAEHLEAVLTRLEQAVGDVDLPRVPSALREAVRALRANKLKRRLCERRRELLENTECASSTNHPAANAKDDAAALQRALAQISVRPAFAGGIPTTATRYLRPLTLWAYFEGPARSPAAHSTDGEPGEPLAQLPLLVHFPEHPEPQLVVTDDSGKLVVDVPSGTSLEAPFTIQLDLHRLLGAEPPPLEVEVTKVHGRRTSIARSALVSSNQGRADDPTLAVIEKELASLLSKKLVLNTAHVAQLRRSALPATAASQAYQQLLPRLADEYRGQLDVLLLLTAESEFASRMGTHRVWFEARGRLQAFDAWTGALLWEVDAAVTESGVGEQRAEQAARTALGRELALKCKNASGPGLALRPSE